MPVGIEAAAFFQMSDSAYISDSGEDTTYQLTPPGGKSASDFQAGKIRDNANPVDLIDLGLDKYTEIEFCMQAKDAAEQDSIYEFRITKSGIVLDTYTLTPQWTIGSGGQLYYGTAVITAVGIVLSQIQPSITRVTVATGVVALVKSVLETISVTAIGIVALTKQPRIVRALTGTGTVVSSASKVTMASAIIVATGIISALIQTRKAIAAVATGVVALVMQSRILYAIVATGIVAVTNQMRITKATVATGVLTSSQALVKLVSAIVTATGILSATQRTFKIAPAIALGIVNLAIQISETFASVATGLVVSIRKTNVNRAVTAVGNLTSSMLRVTLVLAALTATGVVMAVKQVRYTFALTATGVTLSFRKFYVTATIVATGIAADSAYLGMFLTTYARNLVAIQRDLSFSARARGLSFVAFAKKLFFRGKP